MKIDWVEKLFLIFNALIAGLGTAAGFAFPSLAFLAALFNVTGGALIILSVIGVIAFVVVALGVGFYFFHESNKNTTALINQIEAKQESMLDALISYILIKKNIKTINKVRGINVLMPEVGEGEEKILFKKIRKIIYTTLKSDLKSDYLDNSGTEKIKKKLKQNSQFLEHFEKYKRLVFQSHNTGYSRKIINKSEDNLLMEKLELLLTFILSLSVAVSLIVGNLFGILCDGSRSYCSRGYFIDELLVWE